MKSVLLSIALMVLGAGTAMAQAVPGAGTSGARLAGQTPLYAQSQTRARNEGRGGFLDTANPLQQREAEAIAKEAGVGCEVVEAGEVAPHKRGKAITYEIACKDDFGWIVSKLGDKVTAYDCQALESSAKAAKGKLATCRLRSNIGSVSGLASLTKKAGLTCSPMKGEFLGGGGDPPISRYEVLCDGGAGYIIDAPQPRSKANLQSMSCKDAKAAGLSCKLATGKG